MLRKCVFKLLASSVLAGTITAPAFAEEKAANEAADMIIVTGSRIARPDLQGTSPISVVSADVIAKTGAVTIEGVLNQLPQFVPSSTSASNNPGGGQATIDLRGLGASRTLVLVNGRRFIGSGQDGVVDVNQIPTGLIERVDVVTGGASAVYGSDAMSGVVNFVLKQDFEGVELGAGTGISSRGDGAEYTGSVTLGSNLADNRGNITLYGDWYQRRGILASQRGYTAIDETGLAGTAEIGGRFIQGGSSRGTTGSIVSNPSNPNPRVPFDANQLLANGNPCGSFLASGGFVNPNGNRTISFAPDGTARGFCPVSSTFGGDRYNFAPVNYIQIPSQRYSVSAFSHYDLTDTLTAFMDFTYVHTSSANQLASSPLAASEGVTIDPNSPLLSASARAALALRADPTALATVERRMWELGARVQEFKSDLFNGSLGLRGALGDNWRWETEVTYGRTSIDTITKNDLSTSRLQAALNGCPTGAPAGCAAAGSFANFFGGTLTKSQVGYLIYPSLTDRATIKRVVAGGNLSGKLADLPAGPLSVALGVEYRKEQSASNPDAAKQADDIVGFNASDPISGSFTVKEFYGETIVPIVQSLNLEFGARLSDYSTVGSVLTYKAGGTFEPVGGLRLRSMYQRATRAPNVFELYRAADQDFPVVLDPCDGRFFDGSAAVEARCLASGVDPNSFVASNLQVNATRVGNRDLKEEKGDTITIGAVFNGREFTDGGLLKGLSATVDYYNMSIKNAILSEYSGAQAMVDACYINGDAKACSRLSRSASGDTIINAIGFANLAKYKVSGLDIGLGYRVETASAWIFGINTNIGRLLHYKVSDAIRGTADGAGLNSDLGFLPKWKAVSRLTVEKSGVSATLTHRYIGGYHGSFSAYDPIDEANAGTGFEVRYPTYKVAAKHYFDLALGCDVTENVTINLSVDNLLNNKPTPLYDLSDQSNTSATNYDLVGRYMRISARVKF